MNDDDFYLEHEPKTDAAVRALDLRLENARLQKDLEDAYRTIDIILNGPPAEMSTPIGLLPVNPEGMRKLVDELARALRVVEAARALDGHSDTALALSIAIEEWGAGR